MRNSRPVESLPGRTPTTLRTRAIRVSPGPLCQVPTAFWTRVSSPRSVRVATRPSTTRSFAALPATWVSAAICCTCSKARAALNSVRRGGQRAAGPGLERRDAPRRQAEQQGDDQQSGDAAGAPGVRRRRREDRRADTSAS